jgi:hypothetical protein
LRPPPSIVLDEPSFHLSGLRACGVRCAVCMGGLGGRMHGGGSTTTLLHALDADPAATLTAAAAALPTCHERLCCGLPCSPCQTHQATFPSFFSHLAQTMGFAGCAEGL